MSFLATLWVVLSSNCQQTCEYVQIYCLAVKKVENQEMTVEMAGMLDRKVKEDNKNGKEMALKMAEVIDRMIRDGSKNG